ncbi:MAG TPA: hypothetical protein VFO41_18375 [Alphaproteobacteria bacterium]|nr:hypothetical protein [Alphaproteobacteria bacterium]
MNEHRFESPADDGPAAPLRRIAIAVAAGALLALVLQPAALADWAFELPLEMGRLRDGLILAAASWADAFAGLDRPAAALRDFVQALRQA